MNETLRERILREAEEQQNERINGFFGEYRWLSNYGLCQIPYKGIIFPSTEHAYQAMKVDDKLVWEAFAAMPECKHSRRIGQFLKMREDWNTYRVQVMEEVCRIKFQIPLFKERLLETGDKELIENNWWNDRFWGKHDGDGENTLGKILMKIRDEIK